MTKICNHVWRVDGETLPNWPLSKRVKALLPHEFCWLRPGEKKDGYDICPKCHRAVKRSMTNKEKSDE